MSELPITLGGPAILTLVPMLLVGIPASVLAFFFALGAGLSKSNPGPAMIPIIIIAAPLFAIVYGFIRAGWTRMLLKLVAGGQPAISDIAAGKPWFKNMVIVSFIIGVGTAIGGCLLVVPGVYLAVRTSLAPYLVVDEDLGPIEALMRSHELVTGYGWQMLLYYVLMMAANFVAGLIPVVGMVLPIAIMGFFDLALAMIYVMRRGVNSRTIETDRRANF